VPIFFQGGSHPPCWICGARFWTTHEENLVVFITVQNLVGIAAAVFTIQKFEYYVHLAGKCLFIPILGVFWHKN